MTQDEIQEFIKNGHEQYKKLGYVECPAFRGEKVYFNKHGLRHLVRKEKKIRSIYEQVRRFRLLPSAPFILEKQNQFQSNKIMLAGGKVLYFWVFCKTINSIKKRTTRI